MERTWQEVGALVRERRDELGLTREAAGAKAKAAMGGGSSVLSSATLNKIEHGKQEGGYWPRTLIGLARALDWPDDAIDRLAAGDDPATLEVEQPVSISSADGVDFDELKRLDPEGWEHVMNTARMLRDRARGNR